MSEVEVEENEKTQVFSQVCKKEAGDSVIEGRIRPIYQVPLSSRDVTCHPLPSKALGQTLT